MNAKKKDDGLTQEQQKWMQEQALLQKQQRIEYKDKKIATLEEQLLQQLETYREQLTALSVRQLQDRLLEHRRESVSENVAEAELGKLCVQLVMDELRRRNAEEKPTKKKKAPAEVPGQQNLF